MLTIVLCVVSAAVGFVAGVLFGRKNKKGVEAAVAYGKSQLKN